MLRKYTSTDHTIIGFEILVLILNHWCSVADPDPDPRSGAFFTPAGIRIRDPLMGGKYRSGSDMNIHDNFSVINNFLWLKIGTVLKFFDADPDPGWKNSDPV
jgi:hypothetical protein